MKIKFLIMAIVLTASTTLMAGPCEHGNSDDEHCKKHQSKNQRHHFLKDMNMTEAQQKSFKIIMEKQREKMKAAKETIHNETQAELSQILTEEQMQILETKHQKMGKARKQMKKRMKKRHRNRSQE